MSFMNQYLVLLVALSSAGVGLPQKQGTPATPPPSKESALQGNPTQASLAELMGAEVVLEAGAAEKSGAAEKPGATDSAKGKVAELVLSTHGGEIACAALSVGKILGQGEKIVLVPMTAIRPTTVDKRPGFTLRMTKAEIEALPAFEIRKAESEGLDRAVEQARGLGSAGEKSGPAGAREASSKSAVPEYVLSGVLKGCAVEASDKEFGKVQDASVELGSNTVGYLIVSRTEGAGGATVQSLVPMRACQWTHAENKDALKLGKSADQLKSAPEYKKPEKGIATAEQMRAADGFFGGKAATNPQ